MASDLFSARYWNDAASIAAGADAHRLGSGGLFITTDAAPDKGSLLDFELTVGHEPPVIGIVEVVEVVEARRVDDTARGLRAGMRVQFIHLEDEAHARDVLGRAMRNEASRNEAIGDDSVALEEDFFARAALELEAAPEDEALTELSRRMGEPAYLVRRARLQRTFTAIMALASALAAATAIRGATERGARADLASSAPAALGRDGAAPLSMSRAAASPMPVRDPSPVGPTERPAAPAAQVLPPASRLRVAAPPSRVAAPPHNAERPSAPARGSDSIYD